MIDKEEMKKMVHDAVGAYFNSPAKLHHEIERLRKENEKILDGMRDTIKERDILSGENYDLRAKNEKLRNALTSILNDVGYHNPMRMTTEISDKVLEDAAGALDVYNI